MYKNLKLLILKFNVDFCCLGDDMYLCVYIYIGLFNKFVYDLLFIKYCVRY